MQLWGGKICFKEGGEQVVQRPGSAKSINGTNKPPTPPGPDGVLVPPPPPRLDFSPEQMEYLETVVHPLVSTMVQEASRSLPDKLAAFFAQWLLAHLRVPGSLANPVLSWLGLPPGAIIPKRGEAGSRSPKKASGARRVAPLESKGVQTEESSTERESKRQSKKDSSSTERESKKESKGVQGTEAATQTEPTRESKKESSSSEEEDGAQSKRGSAASVYSKRGSTESTVSTLRGAMKSPPPGGPAPVKSQEQKDAAKKRLMGRKVSVSVMKTQVEEFKRDSMEQPSEKPRPVPKKRSRAVSIFVPPPEVPRGEAIELLRKQALFKDFDEEEIAELAASAQIMSFDPDEDVVHFGDKHRHVHVVYAGECRVSVPQVTGTLGKGDSFGSHALMKSHLASNSTMTAIGAENSRLVTLALSKEMLQDLGLLRRLNGRRNGQAANVVARCGTNVAGLQRRNTPAHLRPQIRATPKSDNDKSLILRALTDNTHFCELVCFSDAQYDTMVDMVRLTTVEAGNNVVTIGEKGNNFYIVQDGVLEVLVESECQTEMQHIAVLRVGDSFGEIALLYNSPRKATVRAQRRCELWVLNREQFTGVMREKCVKRIAMYVELIGETEPMLASRLDTHEKETIAEALEEVFFVTGEEVMRAGDPFAKFIIVFDGQCDVIQDGKVIQTLCKGSHFGDRAMFSKKPLETTVVCASETTTLLSLDSSSFAMLLADHFEEIYVEIAEGKGSMAVQAIPAVGPASEEPAADTRQATARKTITQASIIEKLLEDSSTGKHAQTGIPFNRLVPIGVLGYGAFGVVTLQKDTVTERVYALKALSKGYVKREGLTEHVKNERRTLMMLDNPFVVPCHQTFRDDQHLYFLMDAALGGELFDVYANCDDFFGSAEHARFYAACSGFGLEHIHSRKVIYRDLKMENVLLYPDGYAVLTDMGLAKVVIGKTYTVCGTADYFAPETLRQTGHNRAVDWWALGIMIFVMMAGRSPFDADEQMQIYRNIVKGFKKELFPSDFSHDLVELVRSICQKKPEQRLPMGPKGVRHLEDTTWFAELPLDTVEGKTAKPPFKPKKPDYEKMIKKLKAGRPAEVEFVSNDPQTDLGWDNEFDSEAIGVSDL